VLDLSEVCKLPYGGLVVSYRGMTAHALARGRERHQTARIRVRMAELALQTQGPDGFCEYRGWVALAAQDALDCRVALA